MGFLSLYNVKLWVLMPVLLCFLNVLQDACILYWTRNDKVFLISLFDKPEVVKGL